MAVVVGNFNRDTAPDLAVADSTSSTVSVLLGFQNAFANETMYNLQNSPGAVAMGDFNNDGRLDIVATTNANAASILLNCGTGGFRPPVSYLVQAGAGAVAVGDFNNDHNLDLVVTNTAYNANTLSILLGNGNGTFKAEMVYAAGPSPHSVAVGDLNGDGNLDLAVANDASSVNTISILLGNGDGTFQAPVALSGWTYTPVRGGWGHQWRWEAGRGDSQLFQYCFHPAGQGRRHLPTGGERVGGW